MHVSIVAPKIFHPTTFPNPQPMLDPWTPTMLYPCDSHSQVTTPPSDPLLGSSLQSPLELQVVDTLPDGFTVGSTLGCWLLPVSPPDSDSVDEVTLLGLVTQSPCLVGSRWSASSVDDCQLSVFPTSDSGNELENVRLFLGVELLEIFVGTHLVVC